MRDDLGTELRRLNLSGVGVEVGVQAGYFGRQILQSWGKADLWIQVDVWRPLENYADSANVEIGKQEGLMYHAHKIGRIMMDEGYAKQVAQCRNFATECAKLLPDDSVDFVYVDARHDRWGILADLNAYWPKLRSGGIMAGHDYTEQKEPPVKVFTWMPVEIKPLTLWQKMDRLVFERNYVETWPGIECQTWHWPVDPHQSGEDWTLNGDGSRDLSGRVVRGAVDDFFSGEADEAPDDLKRCPRQVVVTYRETSFNTWIVRK
eukprot:gnl/TRDRNA2_/TRDRNA2_43616_c0_seq1.p1 gnl/TRDRNA2_/TRDRNA2_43616_c0~~gnl/TRDRNA2_/TRDRNA2_43616_c0_seq1.p1  ORF type:complete len:262 (+),score=39.49 gnl/TRDRNA2_/TRDRNA2_43616_c0_seq1:104-889(+)